MATAKDGTNGNNRRMALLANAAGARAGNQAEGRYRNNANERDAVALLARQEGAFMVQIPLPVQDAGAAVAEESADAVRDRRVREMDLDKMPVPFPIILDSGASRHMAHDIELFNRLWDAPELQVGTAKDGEVLKCCKMENIILRNNKRQRLEVYDVLFISDLNANILSVSQIEEAG